MLKHIELKNFKSFESLKLDLKPITILLGPNNSGKSSILAAFRLLAQSLMSYDTNVPLLLNGSLGDFGTYRDLIFAHDIKRNLNIKLVADAGFSPDEFSIARKNLSYLDKDLVLNLGFHYRSSLREIIQTYVCVEKQDTPVFLAKYSKGLERIVPTSVHGRLIPIELRPLLSERFGMFHYLPRSLSLFLDNQERKLVTRKMNYLSKQNREAIRLLSTLCRPINRIFSTVEYIGPMRHAPQRTFPFSGERHATVGADGQHAISILSLDALRRGSRSRQIKAQTEAWLREAGIAQDIQINLASDRHFEIQVRHPVTKEYSNYADIGYGNSQVLPVLVGGYNLPPGSLYLVEQPEIHLHPRAQATLGEFFLQLKRNSVQTIVETHSEHLVLRLLQHVADGKIAPGDIALYYVFPRGSKKVLKRVRLDSKALFLDAWPEGFFPDTLAEAKKLARIRAEAT